MNLITPPFKIHYDSMPRQQTKFYAQLFDLGKYGRSKTSSNIRCTDLQHERISTIIYHPDFCKYTTAQERDYQQKNPDILEDILDIPLKKTDQLYVWSCE